MIGTDKRKIEQTIIKIFYLISILFLIILFNPNFIKGVVRRLPYSAVVPGILYPLFIVFFGILCPYAISQIFLTYQNATGYRKNQLRYLFLGFFIALSGGLLHIGAAYLHREIIPHDLLLILWAIVVTYAIIKYRLMDITTAITKTTIFILVYTLVLGLPFVIAIWLKGWLIELFGPSWWMLPLGLMAVLATVGPFIYIYLQRRAEDKLLREQRRYQDSLKQASVGMTRIRNLRKLLDLITHIVTKTVRISYAAIYLYNQETNEYVLQVSRDKDRIPVFKLTADNPLIAWIMQEREPLIYEEVKRQMEDTRDGTYKQLEENMRLLTASVVIPSFLKDEFIGFFVLGDKISGQIYTQDDLNVFQVLASQAALAIENAQFYEEAKEMQEQIAQAEKMATIGTMADGLSHQINNRFYALSLIAGDTIDTIKTMDTSKCTAEVKEMIEEINHALERIQSNVTQGGEVVRGLLKYSRKGDAGFEVLDLNLILDNTLEMVQYKVKLSEIDIIRNFPSNIPKIKGNMAQLEEAFFNFIDNAYDAILERRALLKEEGYRGKIIISAFPKNNNLEIIIEDNGIGIKRDNSEKVFTPFFTTKTSVRKGTGLGLYVIRRIISDMHKGKISFESEYKVGTKFIIELPIAN
jgi:signal transduction histidine kinase